MDGLGKLHGLLLVLIDARFGEIWHLLWRRDIPAADLAAAYRLILGRDMTAEDLLGLSADQRRSKLSLYAFLLHSNEFGRRVAPRPAVGLLDVVHSQYLTTQAVETQVDDPDLLNRLMERTIGQWRAHGEQDPVWSITTDDQYRSDVMTPDRLEAFYASGVDALHIFEGFERRAGHSLRGGTCLELGAGVGRCTEHLAGHFDRVIAVEISSGILDLCRERMAARGITNVECRLLATPEDLKRMGRYDVFFSTAVLQHNAPPIQRLLLDHALAALNPSGHALFQTPDQLLDYSFSTRAYLASEVWSHDMHCLPKPAVLAILAAHGMRVLDAVADGFASQFGSYTYLAQK